MDHETTSAADAAGASSSPTPISDAELVELGKASRRWRSLWRVHFYAGMFAMPFIIVMALTGLVILYTQPIQDATESHERTVTDRGEWVSFDQQEQAVEAAYPDRTVVSMTLPVDSEHSTIFGFDNGHQAYVDPYTAEVLGANDPGRGVVGFANRIHGTLNNSERMISLPTVSALWDDGPVMRDYVIGDLILECFGVWTMVLAMTGIYLWWPRRRAAATSRDKTGRSLFGIRLGKKGRAKWRDLHAVPGLLMAIILAVTLVSGMAWSTYWGPNFTALANEISPNVWTDAPASALGTRDDLDRLGNKIAWNTGDQPIPASYATAADGSLPAALSLDNLVAIGTKEGMKPGYSVYFPDNSALDDAGNPIYGAFTLSNSWPRKTGEARNVYLDQFTGAHLSELDAYGLGSVSYAMDSMVSWHMGTQWGIVSRIFMTLLCVLAMWSVTSAFVMYWKRRRKRSLGLPRRPVDVGLAKRLTLFACVLAIAFPEWGATALLILLFDKFVIRNVPRLRASFGQR